MDRSGAWPRSVRELIGGLEKLRRWPLHDGHRLSASHAVVIGAGIGGLTAALDLARRGIRVSVFERAPGAGGKMREVDVEGRKIDSGPTVLTMPWIFEELFSDAGSRLDEHLVLHPADLLARHAWADGGRLDLFADVDRSARAIREMSGRDEGRRFLDFCRHAQQVYETLYGPFMRSQRPSMLSLAAASGLRGLVDMWRIHPFETLWHRLGKSFRDPRLQGLFARYATYCGASPLRAPATLMLVAHVEQRGVWQVEGGMQRLAEAIARLLEHHGGSIHYDTAVREVELESGEARGVRLDSGERVPADAVIANTDVAGLRDGQLGSKVAAALPADDKSERSLSAVTFSLLAETSGFDLAHHNVFFPADYPQEFVDIFEHQRLPARPAVYICAQDRGIDTERPSGPERLFMITNAPPLGDRRSFDAEQVAPTRSAAFELLEACGLALDSRAEDGVTTTPADFEARFPGTGGALYGSAAHGWRSSFSRPGATCDVPGLYLAGGSVHPGPGVPMVAISGRLAAEAASRDFGWNAKR